MANKGKPFSDNDVDYPRITFQTTGRIFDRLLKESSLSDLEETVRKKLGLGSGSVIQFSQLRNGQLVDLEDEDDFDAFRAVAYEQRYANVQVVLTENSVTEDSSVDAKGSTLPLPPTPASALPSYGRLNANSRTSDPGAAAPRKKVVLRNEDGIEVDLETLTTKVSPIPPTPSVTARRNLPATPMRRPAPIRIETPEQRLEEEEHKEKEAKAKASAEERAKSEKEKEERRNEEERLKKEEEEEKQLRRQEEKKEWLRREEEEKERLRKEDEAKELRRKEEEQKELERLLREEEEKRRREQEEEAKAQMPRVDDAAKSEEQAEEDELTQEPEEAELQFNAKERSRKALCIDTALSEKWRPGPLDLSNIKPPPSSLALARPLGNLDSITYPEGIRGPRPELNVGAKEGKFRYDRDFLMQFMSTCEDKPDSLPPLDAIGLKPVDPLSLTRGGSGRHRQLSGTSAPSRQALIGGGLPGAAIRGQFQSMGSFTTTPSKLRQSEAPGNHSVSMSGPTMPFRNPPLQRIASQGGVGPMKSHRTRTKRKKKISEGSEGSVAGVRPQAYGEPSC